MVSAYGLYRAQALACVILRAAFDELPDDIRQDATVAECDKLLGRVDPRGCHKFHRTTLVTSRHDSNIRARLETRGNTNEIERLGSGQLQRCCILPRLEFQRQDAHVHEV